MANLLNCVFCNNCDENLILFTEETLKKCRVILQHRKEHNLKFKDVVLPGELFESGYHRNCYKSFTGLNKKYYLPKNTATEKANSTEKLLSIAENLSTDISTTVELDTQCIQPEASTSQHFNPAAAVIPDTTTIPSPSVLPELVEPDFPRLEEYIDHPENIDSLSDSNTAVDIDDGEISVPQDLLDFYSTLIAGNNRRRKNNQKCIRQVKSYCEDVVYSIYNGKIKTSKHIMLGMALKSLTSSRKIIDIIHRYGHCISYPGVEELETEATYTSVEKSSVCPETIKKSPDLCTGLAFDNFDRFVETKTGKDTLHDTVGIIYQNIDMNTPDEPQLINITDAHTEVSINSQKRRRRTFDAISMEISEEPLVKKMKITDLEASACEDTEPINLPLYKTIDTLWMFSHALQLPNVPMWVGFNSFLVDNNSPQQIVSYLTPINQSPTNKSVVLETMKQSQQICEEVKQSSIQVTYDLAIAKIALQIQASHKPDLDNLFIHWGPFHIMMAYFKTIGKFIMHCGLTNVMVQSNLLASGSVNGFLEGKHFNRCKRLHPLMAVGLEILHFKSFLESNNITISDQIIQEITRLRTSSISSLTIEDDELNALLQNYDIYKQKTLNGEFVYRRMKYEAEKGVENLSDARWRTAQAVGYSEHTISNILKEERQAGATTSTDIEQKIFKSPSKRKRMTSTRSARRSSLSDVLCLQAG
ncbi:hypothetical protein ACJJTC_019418 [Scirpophaga incertulas]